MIDFGKANRGRGAEAIVTVACEEYRRQGRALITKVPTPTTILSKGGGFFKARSICDFIGTLSGGRALAIEVKSTRNKGRFPLDRNTIKENQLRYLQDNAALGGVSVYLFLFSSGGFDHCQVVLLPVLMGWIAERKSIPFNDLLRQTVGCAPVHFPLMPMVCDGFALPFTWDFLPALEKLSEGRR